MRLIIATNNKNKLREFKEIIGDKNFEVLSLDDFEIKISPDENGNSYIENADIKSKAAYDELCKLNEPNHLRLLNDDYIIADDTGLSIDKLNGAPGIKSARFLGEDISQSEKNNKILELLKDTNDEDRTAHFTTVLSVIHLENGNINKLYFEGRIDGYIAKNIEMTGGFGYDPIFAIGNPIDIKKGTVKTFSNIGQEMKNKVSHRAIAISKLVDYLEKNHNI